VEIAFGERNVVVLRSYKEFTAFIDKVSQCTDPLYTVSRKNVPICFRLYISRFVVDSNASAVLGLAILCVRQSIYPLRVLCDETKERTADILTAHERANTLVFWHQDGLVGDVPVYLKFALKW